MSGTPSSSSAEMRKRPYQAASRNVCFRPIADISDVAMPTSREHNPPEAGPIQG